MLLTLVLLAQTTTATPGPAAKLGGGFGQKTVATAKARVVITDAGVPRPTSKAPVAAPRAAVPEGPAPVDDEAVWKAKVAGLRADLKSAQEEYDAAEASAPSVVSFGPPGRRHAELMMIRDASLAPARAKVMAAQRAINKLPEECRTTPGCQPGWVR